VVEAFTTIESKELAFAAKSTPMVTIEKQISLAAPLVDNLIGFSYTYFNPSSRAISRARSIAETGVDGRF